MNDPRRFDADDLNGPANPTGFTNHADPPDSAADDVTNEATGNVTHNSDPETTDADDVTNEATGKFAPEFPDVVTKVVTGPDQPDTAPTVTAETA